MSFDVSRTCRGPAGTSPFAARVSNARHGVLAALLLAACHGDTAAEIDGAPAAFDGGSPLPGQIDVLTQHNDVSRTGQNLGETVLNTSNVNGETFGKLFSVPVDGIIYGQPLLVSHYPVGGAEHDVLLVTTAHNSVYTFDANAEGPPLWTVNLGTPVPHTVPCNGIGTRNIPIEIGIIATPVIDRANNLVYVTNKTYDATAKVSHQWLHVLELATGSEEPGSPLEIKATVKNDAGETQTLDAAWHAQRPALLLFNGAVYMAFASHEDCQPYHGWVLGYRYDPKAKTLAQTAVLSLSLDGTEAGIWQSGQGLISDGTSIYGVTANGSLTAQNGGKSYGEAFVKMSPSLEVLDWFAPVGYLALNARDIDLGAGGPVLLPENPPLLVGGGKEGMLYLVDTTNMGHLGVGTDTNLQEFPATNSIYGAPVIWTGGGATRLYLWGVGDVLKEFLFTNGRFQTTPAVSTPSSYANLNPPDEDPVGILAVSSNGTKAGTGILWGTKPLGNPDHLVVPGTLYAFDALTLKELWDSRQNTRDDFGNFAKFVPPTIANGKVYVASDGTSVTMDGTVVESVSGEQVVVYGLREDEDGGK